MSGPGGGRRYTVLEASEALPGDVARDGRVVAAELDAAAAFAAIDQAGPGRFAVVDSATNLTYWASDRRTTRAGSAW